MTLVAFRIVDPRRSRPAHRIRGKVVSVDLFPRVTPRLAVVFERPEKCFFPGVRADSRGTIAVEILALLGDVPERLIALDRGLSWGDAKLVLAG